VLLQIEDESVEFQVIDIDPEVEGVILEGKKFRGQRFLYPMPSEEQQNIDSTLDFILRSKLRMYEGAIVIDEVNTVTNKFLEYLVIPKWCKNRKGEIDAKIGALKYTAEKKGVKCVEYEWVQ